MQDVEDRLSCQKIELLDENKNEFTFRALVTKGCYIRSLIRDIGSFLDTYTVMSELVRTKLGTISIDDVNTLEEIENMTAKEYKIEELLDYPIIEVDSDEKKIMNGMMIKNEWDIIDKVIFKNKKGELLGIYEKNEDMLKVWKNFT